MPTRSADLARRWSEQLREADFPPAPEWLTQLRAGAAGAFEDAGLPHRKVEAWKYTPMKALEELGPSLPGPQPVEPGLPDLPEALSADVPRVVLVDGAPGGRAPDLPPGVSLLPLDTALARFEDRLRPLAERIDVAGATQAFAALNTAFIQRSWVLHVERGVDAGQVLLQWVFSELAAGALNFSRLFVLLDDGAGLDLVEQFEGERTGALNVMYQAQLGEGARLSHVRLQNERDTSVLMTATAVEQSGGSEFVYRGFDLGGGLVRHELNVTLAGPEAHCDLAGACVLDGRRHGDTRIDVDHAAPGCSSEQFFRGVLGGRSRGVFNGRAMIRKGADGSSVQQSNANLLLSRLAEIDTKPELEIYADEVEASHGATVGQLDENAVFYLRSRGLDEAGARHMLTAAFCHAVTDRLDDRALAETIGAMVDRSMPEAQ
jgi:Fe-S cluster assembly protein SufD